MVTHLMILHLLISSLLAATSQLLNENLGEIHLIGDYNCIAVQTLIDRPPNAGYCWSAIEKFYRDWLPYGVLSWGKQDNPRTRLPWIWNAEGCRIQITSNDLNALDMFAISDLKPLMDHIYRECLLQQRFPTGHYAKYYHYVDGTARFQGVIGRSDLVLQISIPPDKWKEHLSAPTNAESS